MLRRARPLLGTYVEVAAHAATPACEWRALEAALDAVADVHRLMSFHEDASDVARLNRRAHRAAVEVDPRTLAVLRRAQEFARWSGGRFDCTVGGRLVELGRLPGRAHGPRHGDASWVDVELLPGSRVRFRRPLAVDLGGIAKGYAVDQAAAALERAGALAGLVNAGGDLRAIGDRAWPVAVRSPDAAAILVPLPALRARALATTADCVGPGPGGRGGDVVEPSTGRRWRLPQSVTVLAPTCMDADALTKVVWLSDAPPLALLERLGAEVLVLRGRAPLAA